MLCIPLFHVVVISVHCVFLSVCVSVQEKLPRMSPPQCATVSICVSPGLTWQAITSSPDLHSMASRIGLLRPERLLSFTANGLIRGRPLKARSSVEALVERMASLSSLGFMSATHSSYSRTILGSSATKCVVQGQPTVSHVRRTFSRTPVPYVLPRPLRSR